MHNVSEKHYAKWKKSDTQKTMYYMILLIAHSTRMTLQRANLSDRKQISACQGLRLGKGITRKEA